MGTSEEVLNELHRRVNRRRQEGKYPTGLEDQLEAEFKSILEVVHRGQDEVERICHLIEELRASLVMLNGVTSPESRIPGGKLFHRTIARLVARQTRGVAQQTQLAITRQLDVLDLVAKQLRAQRDADVRVLHQLEHAMMDRLMMVDALAEAIIELERKVDSKDT